ncbi:MAG TPA: hypothetical protein VFG12_06385 [Rhodopila sp.]|jgi:hypothetical protein|nr:hypothetical protein [Rhodopila sp.]
MTPNDLVNRGMILRPGATQADVPRTFIVSGIGRGGTTLAVTILRDAGVFVGDHVAEVSVEDLEMLTILQQRDPARLDRLIARRNASGKDWGFKVPHIAAYLQPSDLARFRNPHLIVIFRDPVAITVRHAIAEQVAPVPALQATTEAMHGLAGFVTRATCPALLLSYEKALIFPGDFLNALASFCAIPLTEELRQLLMRQIRPNADDYINRARRSFAGVIDHLRDGILSGWCCEIGSSYPVDLDLFCNGIKVLTFKADRFRPDLAPAGFGDGNSGFSLDLAPLALPPQTRVQIRVSERVFELANSGRRLVDYAA